MQRKRRSLLLFKVKEAYSTIVITHIARRVKMHIAYYLQTILQLVISKSNLLALVRDYRQDYHITGKSIP